MFTKKINVEGLNEEIKKNIEENFLEDDLIGITVAVLETINRRISEAEKENGG